jgi:hypothetical protein
MCPFLRFCVQFIWNVLSGDLGGLDKSTNSQVSPRFVY